MRKIAFIVNRGLDSTQNIFEIMPQSCTLQNLPGKREGAAKFRFGLSLMAFHKKCPSAKQPVARAEMVLYNVIYSLF